MIMDEACKAIGRELLDIVIHSDDAAPPSDRYMATWGPYDLGCIYGIGATPDEARWELINFTKPRR